jgi:hypothetical protein
MPIKLIVVDVFSDRYQNHFIHRRTDFFGTADVAGDT